MKIFRRIGRIILSLIIVVLVLIFTTLIAIQIPAVQTRITHFVLEKLNKSLNTKINVDSVDIDFFGKIHLYDIKIKDDHDLDFIKSKSLVTTLNIWSLIPGIKQSHIKLSKVKLIEPEIRVITYKGDSISNFIKFVNGFSSDKPKDPNDIFKLDGDFLIEKGKVSIVNKNSGNVWLDAFNLDLSVKNFRLADTDIKADIEKFNFSAKRNNEIYNVKKLTGKAHYSEKEIKIDNLKFLTDTSNIDGNLLLSYGKSEDMSDFANKVKLNIDLKRGSKINFKEIRYFEETFDKNSSIDIFGKINGTLNNLVLTDFELKGEDNYFGANHFQLNNILENNLLSFSTKNSKINTSYVNIKKLLPTYISSKIPALLNRFGNINYRGDISFNTSQIVANGYAISGLGEADIRAQINNYNNTEELSYKGTVNAKNLNLRQLTEVKDLGYVNGAFKFDGKGIDLKKIKLDLNGNLNYIDLLGKRYKNVSVDGLVKNYQFNGLFDVKDPNLDVKLNGKINFGGKPYEFDFVSNVRKVNLDFLGITKKLNAIVKGKVNGKFKLSNINDFRGYLSVKDLYFRSKKDTLQLDEVKLNSKIDGNSKKMQLEIPNYLTANIEGNFYATEVLNVANNTLVDLIPSFKKKKVSKNQEFSFDILIRDNILKYIDPSIEIEPNTHLKGSINGNRNELDATLRTKGISYQDMKLFKSDVNLNAKSKLSTLDAKIDSLKVGKISINDINIASSPKNDTMVVNTDFKIGSKNPINFDLKLYHIVKNENDLIFGFSPSTIKIDSTVWTINSDNDLNTDRVIYNRVKKSFRAEELSLQYDNQYFLISGIFNNNRDYNFNAEFKDLDLERVIPKNLVNSLKIAGIVNGKVDILRTKEKLEPVLQAKIDNLGVNDFELGDLTLSGGYDVVKKEFNFNSSLEKDQIQSLVAYGKFENKSTGPELDVLANFDEFHIDFLEGFLGSVFSNMRGSLSGDLKVAGPIDIPNLEGTVRTKDLGLKVNFLGVDYLFTGENVVNVSKKGKTPGVIMLDEVGFKDTSNNTQGRVNGAILFKNFSRWGLNLQFTTDNLLVMDTSIRDNDLFYGKIFAKGDIYMFGPVEELNISGDATILGNSELTINTGSTTVESENSLVRFVPDQHQDDNNKDNSHGGLGISINVNVNPNSVVNLVFDAAKNDKASVRGTSENLHFIMNKSGINLTGVYSIDKGTYEFRQFPLLPKDFSIKRGSTVQFTGSPLDAVMDITAEYRRYVSNVGDYLGTGSSQIYDAILSINIAETLKKPRIDFGLSIPNAGSDINSQLQSRFRSNAEEQMLQFSYILLTGKFGDASAVQSGVTSTAADIGLSTIAGMLSSIAGNLDVQMEYVGGSVSSQTNDKIRTSVSYRINNRLSVKGSYGIAVTNNNIQESFDGNFDITYDISKLNNQSLIIRGFTKPTTFGLLPGIQSNLNQSFGVGIQYSKKFDTFREFLGLADKKDKKENKEKGFLQNKEEKSLIQDTLSDIEKEENIKLDTIKSINNSSVLDTKKIEKRKISSRRRLVKLG